MNNRFVTLVLPEDDARTLVMVLNRVVPLTDEEQLVVELVKKKVESSL